MIFIYDPVTTIRTLISEKQLLKTYQQYPGWKVYESFTGNPEVATWAKSRIEEKENDTKNKTAID